MPITHLTFLIGTLAIAGFPFLSGFYSKDEILAHAFQHGMLVYSLLMIAVTMTAIYMFRLYFLTFHGKFRSTDEAKAHVHESGLSMTLPLMVLAVLSIFGGALNLPGIFLHKSAHWFDHYLTYGTKGLSLVKAEHLSATNSIALMCAASAIALGVLAWAYQTYVKKGNTAHSDETLQGWEKLSNAKLYWDEAYARLFVEPTSKVAGFIGTVLDVQILRNGVYALADSLLSSASLTKKWQNGYVGSYLFWMVIGMIAFISYYILKFALWN
jgi:NADH-quinone oxidoreductase subunit L